MARIALIADRSPAVRAHQRVPALLDELRGAHGLDLEAYWVPTDQAQEGVGGFDGVWVLPGSPYRSEAGALAAIRQARETTIPFLGTCGGFQHALLEFARNVVGDERARHAENEEGDHPAVIEALACSLAVREGRVTLTADSRVAALVGGTLVEARYNCSYGPNPEALAALEAHGMAFTGTDDEGAVRVAELPGHPFYLATLFQPELDDSLHPIIVGFARAAVDKACG